MRSSQPACTTRCPRPCRARHEVDVHHHAAALARLQRACGGKGSDEAILMVLESIRDIISSVSADWFAGSSRSRLRTTLHV